MLVGAAIHDAGKIVHPEEMREHARDHLLADARFLTPQCGRSSNPIEVIASRSRTKDQSAAVFVNQERSAIEVLCSVTIRWVFADERVLHVRICEGAVWETGSVNSWPRVPVPLNFDR